MTGRNLLQAMGHIDPRLIAEAAPDVPHKKKANRAWVKWAAVAACLVLIIGVGLIIQTLKPTPGPPEPPPPFFSPGTVHIQSLDTLNYYGGLLAIKKTQAPVNPLAPTTSASRFPSTSFSPLSYEQVHTPVLLPLAYETEPQHYDIEQITEYTITKSIYFEIIVSEACPFLYEVFGDGKVDAVVTKNNIDTIITFQKDKTFYSCFYAYGDETMDVFTTGKYVDGEYVISDSTSEAALFYVTYEYDKTLGQYVEDVTFEWSVGEDGERVALSLVDFSVMRNVQECSLSLQEISDYYYSVYTQGLPNGELKYAYRGTVPSTDRQIYLHVFTSGEFYICDEKFLEDNDDPFAFYLKGMNADIPDGGGLIILQYTDENGEDVVFKGMASADGFKFNDIFFAPYSITESDAKDLPVLYFVTYNENGEVLYYLRTRTDGTFITGEPIYVDPYYDGYIENKVKDGYWGINSEGSYFIYYKGNKKITVNNVDFEGGEALPIFDRDYYLCDDPFPPDEVTDIRKTVDGFELHITRDRHYSILNAEGGVLERGYLKFTGFRNGVDFYVEQPDGRSECAIRSISVDGSIAHAGYIFFPSEHLIFDPTLTKDPGDIVMRFDIISDTSKKLTLYILRDNNFLVWDHRLAEWIYGKGIALFENDGIRFMDYVGYDEKPDLFAAWTDSSHTELTLDGDVYRLVYDLRID